MHRFSRLAALLPLLLFAACGGDALPDVSSEDYRASVTAFYQAVAAVQAGEEVGARAGFERVTELAPSEPAAWANLGLLALRRNDFAEADRLFARAHDLAPDDAHIEMLRGYLSAAQGQFAEAASHYERAYSLDSLNVKAAYALALELERQSTPETEARAGHLMHELTQRHPENLALTIESARLAIKRRDAEALAPAITRLNEHSAEWGPEVREQLEALGNAAAAEDYRNAATRLAFVRNLLLRLPRYRQDLAAIQTPVEQPGDFLTKFVRLPEPPRSPSPADTTISFSELPVAGAQPAVRHAGFMYASGDAPPVTWVLSGAELLIGEQTRLAFPGNADELPADAHPVMVFDFDYDYQTDVALAGPGGLRILRGDGQGGFTDVTEDSGLPSAVLTGNYHGAWVFDGDLEGDLDLLLAPTEGPPVTLRNDGDGTFTLGYLFGEVASVRGFTWADLDEDADPDAAFLDDDGNLRVFLNERGGTFKELESADAAVVSAIGVSDLNADGRFDLLTLGADGSISQAGDERGTVLPAGSAPGGSRLLVADIDNNGALDLVTTSDNGSILHLSGSEGLESGHRVDLTGRVVDVGDMDGDGRLDLMAIGPRGPVVLRNEATVPYRWQVIRPRSAQATGDQRINSFGIGGQIEVRSGLLFQKQVISSPQIQFGLGDRETTDVARIIWPNGDVQAEFNLNADQPLLTQQRLKGSCPWLFAFDGEKMAFVTDFIWRSPLGLAINGQEQAGVVLTADRVKIRGDQLAPRNGVYDVRITAELWETHFFDEISLLAVDHPEGTEVFVDERFSVPAPDLEPKHMKALRPIAAAFDDKGADVTALVAELDARYLGTFERGRYQGVAKEHYVEVHLGPDAPRNAQVWLVAQGWVRPTDSSVNVAMSQGNNPPPQSIQLEAQAADGSWQIIGSDLGFPAGKTKTLLFPIGEVLAEHPAGKIRLRTNLEVYWDAIRWAEALPDERLRITHLAPSLADIRYRGYSRVSAADASSPEIPVYAPLRTRVRQWYDLEGFYTRFGDVKPLLAAVDDRYVIMNAGDEIRLEFPEMPAPPAGYVRDFFLQGDGWVKDGDYNTTHSRTVRPLPLHEDTAYRGPLVPLHQDPGYLRHPSDWEEYHTRYVAPDGFAESLAPR